MCDLVQEYREALGLARFQEEGTRAEAVEVANEVISNLRPLRNLHSLDEVAQILQDGLDSIAEICSSSDGHDMAPVVVGDSTEEICPMTGEPHFYHDIPDTNLEMCYDCAHQREKRV